MNEQLSGKEKRKELKKALLIECIQETAVREMIRVVSLKQPVKNKEIEDYFIKKEKKSRSTIYRTIERCCEAGLLEKSYYGNNKYLEVKKETWKTLEKVRRFLEIEKKYFPEKILEQEAENEFVLDAALSSEL